MRIVALIFFSLFLFYLIYIFIKKTLGETFFCGCDSKFLFGGEDGIFLCGVNGEGEGGTPIASKTGRLYLTGYAK